MLVEISNDKLFPVYRVTKGNTDGSIIKDDLVFYSLDGNLVINNDGFFTKDELDDKTMSDFICKEDMNHYGLKLNNYNFIMSGKHDKLDK